MSVVQEHLEQDKAVSCECKDPLSTTQPHSGASMELEQGCCAGEIRQVGGCWLTHVEGLTAEPQGFTGLGNFLAMVPL